MSLWLRPRGGWRCVLYIAGLSQTCSADEGATGGCAGLSDGAMAVCASATGAVTVRVAYDAAMRPGCLALPHGYGMTYPDPEQPDHMMQYGPYANLLTASSHCDDLAKTPFHKYVLVHIRPLPCPDV